MRIIKKYILIILFVLVTYYFFLPAINLQSPEFWIYLFFLTFGISIINIIFDKKKINDFLVSASNIKKIGIFHYLIIGGISLFALIFLINIFNTPFFRAKSYANRIKVDSGDFAKDVKEVDFNKLALLDKDSSIKLGDKVMGQMTDLVSQFEVSNAYTQINYKDEIIRVTPLEYANNIKYLTNRKKGIPGYITVNSVTGDAKLEKLDKGMKYMPSSLFFENLYRKLRIRYPFKVFGEINFEIDDNGTPYWVVETLKFSGIGLKKEVKEIILLNPINGESKKYNLSDVPKWVDHVYSSNLIIEQLNNWGLYKNGFFNSVFGQKNVVKTTEGYNYLSIDNNIYLYTGLTSVSNDGSNIGFVLVNLRTKDTKIYKVSGTIEKSAMASAEGQVQQMNYKATFPLLINLENNPTYLLSLKDNAGLVKMYAFIDYKDHQKVVVTDASFGIQVAANNYLEKNNSKEKIIKNINIQEISSAVISGNTYYFIKDKEEIYKVNIKVNQKILPFLKTGNKIKAECLKNDIWEIIKIVE